MSVLSSGDVFGSDADGDEAGGEAADEGLAGEEAEYPRRGDGRGVAEGARELLVGEDLEGLGEARREFAAVLDFGERHLRDVGGVMERARL